MVSINIDARVALQGDEVVGSGAITGDGQSVTILTTGMAMVAVQLNGTLTAGAIRLLTTLVAQDTGLSPFFLDSWEHGDIYSVDTVRFYDGIIMYVSCAGLDSIQIVSQSGFTGSLTVDWKATSLTNMVKVLGQVKVIPQVGGDLFPVSSGDGDLATIGTTTDADSTNTVIGRLKQLVTRLTAIEALVDGLEGFTDGVEALLTTVSGNVVDIEALLTTISGNVDGLEGFTDGLEAQLTTVIGHIDGLEALLTTISGNVDGLEGFTDGVETLLTALSGVAHDAVDSGNPFKMGAKAIAHGTNPTAVAAADRTDLYANRAGVLFTIGGHPNVQTVRANYTGAQTDAALVTVSAGTKIVVTRVTITASKANTVNVSAVVGFAAATTPTTTGVLAAHPGIPPGGGLREGEGSGILGVGADGEDVRVTSSVPTGGSIDICVSYFTVES